MNIAVCMIVLNEEEFIEKSIENIYDWKAVKQIIIIEGADRKYPREAVNCKGLSVDNTAQLIRNFPDPKHKITFIQYGFVEDKRKLRSQYSERINEDTEIVYCKDCDEFLIEEDFPIFEEIFIPQQIESWTFPVVHLWHGLDLRVLGGYADLVHTRFFRYISPFRYFHNHNWPRNEHGVVIGSTLGANVRYNRNAEPGIPRIIHFGFARNRARRELDNQFYVNRGELKDRPKTCEFRQFHAEWRPGLTPLPGISIEPYTGKMPREFRKSL